MDIYKKAVRKNLTFATSVGVLTVNQLFTLSMSQLENSIKNLKKKMNDAGSVGDLEFLVPKKSKAASDDELRFEILKDVYITLAEESEKRAKSQEMRRNREKIMAIIADKQDEALKNKSVEDLMKELNQFEEESE